MPDSLRRLAPLTGIVFAVLLVVTFATPSTPDVHDTGVQVINHYRAHHGAHLLGDLTGGVGVVFFLFFISSLRSFFRDKEGADGLSRCRLRRRHPDRGGRRGLHQPRRRPDRCQEPHHPAGRSGAQRAEQRFLLPVRDRAGRVRALHRAHDHRVRGAAQVARLGDGRDRDRRLHARGLLRVLRGAALVGDRRDPDLPPHRHPPAAAPAAA